LLHGHYNDNIHDRVTHAVLLCNACVPRESNAAAFSVLIEMPMRSHFSLRNTLKMKGIECFVATYTPYKLRILKRNEKLLCARIGKKGVIDEKSREAQSFGCCSGSNMNPPSKCSVWTDP
jgi:hypothetical protein